jgi:hypothetical protein
MKKTFAAAAVATVLFGATIANAQAQTNRPFPEYEFDASLPFQFATNALLAPTNAQSDFYVSPFFQLKAGDIDVSPTFNYSVYANVGPDIFGRVRTADDGLAVVGGKLQQKFGNLGIGAVYEHGLTYDGVFRTLLFQSDDFTGFVGYTYSSGPFSAVPSFSITYRYADLTSQERFLYTLKAVISQNLTKDLTLSLTPRLRYYDYTAGTSVGRRDTRGGAILGLTYSIIPHLSTTGSVEYDTRTSNTAGKSFNDTIFLISLDYAQVFDRPK